MKGLILAGGDGTRLRPITHTRAKQLVPVANKPILVYGIEAMRDAGVKDLGVVVGATRADIAAAVGDGSRWGVDVTYIHQGRPLGLAHCVLVSRSYLGDDDFVMYLGDNMLEEGLAGFVGAFVARRPNAQILLAEVDNPSAFGVAELDNRGRVVRLAEKPDNPPSKLALVGVYIFDATIHDAVRAITPSPRGELEITDAIQWLIDTGHSVHHETLSGWWIDAGKKDPLLECNRLVLDGITERVAAPVPDGSTTEGRVDLDADVVLVRSRVRGPTIIGAGTRLTDSYVGPYTAISAGCHIEQSEIDHSVVLEGCRIRGARLTDSLIGRYATVERSDRKPQATRLMLGDYSTVVEP